MAALIVGNLMTLRWLASYSSYIKGGRILLVGMGYEHEISGTELGLHTLVRIALVIISALIIIGVKFAQSRFKVQTNGHMQTNLAEPSEHSEQWKGTNRMIAWNDGSI